MTEREPIVQIERRQSAYIIRVLCPEIVEQREIRRLEDAIWPLVEDTDGAAFVFDFTTVQFISSPFLGFLLGVRNQVNRRRGRMLVCCLGNNIKQTGNDTYVHELFKIVKLDKFFDLCNSIDEALAKLPDAP